MRGKAHDEQTRAAVVAALLAGSAVTETARKYNLPQSTVSRIKAEISTELDKVALDVRDELDTLLVSHLRNNIAALNRIADQTKREPWLEKQTAEGIAALYSKIADHTIRLLEAASATEPPPEGE